MPHRPARRLALALIAPALAGLALGASATAEPLAPKHAEQRLVVRGEATVTDAPCAHGLCLELTDAVFRGAPVGTGAYSGRIRVRVADAFPNGEGGVCAPLRGTVTLGVGSPDRLVLALAGDSCQDGAGDPATTAFTGLARFMIRRATGAWAGATGSGLVTFAEDAADRDRMTFVGRLTR